MASGICSQLVGIGSQVVWFSFFSHLAAISDEKKQIGIAAVNINPNRPR